MKRYWFLYCKTIGIVALLSLAARPGWGQQATLDTLVQRFDRYQGQALQEKVFLHLDRTFYVSGEIMWMKLYLVDGLLHQPLSLSKVAYVEVLDTAHHPVLQTKLSLQEGTGEGSFYLPVSTPSGHYVVRAYTNWMKNFEPGSYFEQPVTVVNPFSHPDLSVYRTPPPYEVQFFPEGGNLVYGAESKVAFKAIDHRGTGVDISGAVINQRQDTLAQFRSLKFGMGHFTFTPQPGEQYRAVVAQNDTSVAYDLPGIYPEGYVMKLTEAGSDQVEVTVRARGDQAAPAVYLLVHTRQALKVATMIRLEDGAGEYRVDKQSLGEGISHFTVFDDQLRAVCERLYFRQPTRRLLIEAQADQPAYATREPVAVQLLTRDAQQNPVPADLSMAVYRVDSLSQFEPADLYAYMWLTSELKGRIESPDYYLSSNDPDVAEATDNLMLTQGWRRFKWETVLRSEPPDFTFLPEYEGPIISGLVRDEATGELLDSGNVYLSVPGKYFQFYNAVSEPDGTIEFVTKDIRGSTSLYLYPDGLDDPALHFELRSPFSEQPARLVLPPFDLSESIQEPLQLRSVSMQVQNIFSDDERTQLVRSSPDSLFFYGVPDRTYRLDDFTRFPTMEEVMREYVREVAVRKRARQFHFRVLDEQKNIFFTSDPLVLVDGLPVFDVNQVIDLDPLIVQRIEVIVQRFILHRSVFPGIVSYVTYDGDPSLVPLDPRAVKIAYDGLQQRREFYSPQYPTEAQLGSRKPDLRTLLHWDPALDTGPQGGREVRFFTSDQPGVYVGVIQGMSGHGLMGSSSFTFEVTAKPVN